MDSDLKRSSQDNPSSPAHYTVPQIKAAWRLMCRGEKEGLRKKDIERIIRSFRPCTSSSEFEQLVGQLKARFTYAEVKHILMKESLPKVRKLHTTAFQCQIVESQHKLHTQLLRQSFDCAPLTAVQDFDPVLAAFRVFDRDHSSSISADELKFFVGQLPDIGKVRHCIMRIVCRLLDAQITLNNWASSSAALRG